MKKFKPHDLSRLTLHYFSGYFIAVYPDHPYSAKDGRVLFHRLVLENYLKRYLLPNEVVHHIDKNKQNNRVSNLQLTNAKVHRELHRKPAPIRVCKYKACGKTFVVTDRLTSAAKYSSSKYCSAKCREDAKRAALTRSVKKVGASPGHRGRPAKKVLRKMVWEIPTTKIARKFGVTDSTIAKWCKAYGISKPPRGHWAKHYSSV